MSQVVHMLLHFRQDMADVSGRTVAELVDAPACPDPKSAARCGRHRQYIGLRCCRLHIFLHEMVRSQSSRNIRSQPSGLFAGCVLISLRCHS